MSRVVSILESCVIYAELKMLSETIPEMLLQSSERFRFLVPGSFIQRMKVE
jgi:hypothetical protein